ncbi:Sodium/hydrogen exchanger 7 [Galdieria sulphuraria]|nr:Sodium/hydrogen exchanger 7 [Galdieria sulphuraria]
MSVQMASENLTSFISEQCPALYSWTPEAWMAVLFPFLGLVVACFARQFLERPLGIHFSVLVLLSGCLVGVAGCFVHMAELSASLSLWVDVQPPNLLLYVLLPPIVFDSAINIDWFIFRKQIFNVFLLAFILVLAFTFCTAAIVIYILRVEWPFTAGAMFGAILSATDPIAIIALLKSSGASPSVITLLDGESLFNDGSAYTLFYAFLISLRKGYHENPGKIVLLILKESLGAIGLGLLFGYSTVFFLHHVWSAKVEIGFSVAISYLAFYVAQGPAGVSGLICLVVTGLIIAADRLSGFSPLARDALTHFWNIISFIANAVVFFYAGFIATISIILFWNDGLSLKDLFYIPILYLLLSLLRYCLLFLCSPILRHTVSNFSWGEIFLVGHSALRGPISLILSQIVFHEGGVLKDNRNDYIVARVVIWTSGFAILTLLINGTTIHWLTKLFYVSNAAKKTIFERAEQRLERMMKDSLEQLKQSRWYAGTDWVFVETLLDSSISPQSKKFRKVLKQLASHSSDDSISWDNYSLKSNKPKPLRSSLPGTDRTRSFALDENSVPNEEMDEPPPEQTLLVTDGLHSQLHTVQVETDLSSEQVNREVMMEYRKRALQGMRHYLQKQYIRGIVFPEVYRELESGLDEALCYPYRRMDIFDKAEETEWGSSLIDRFIVKRVASWLWFRWLASRILYGRHRLGTNFAASLWSSITYVRSTLSLPELIVRELRAERLKCLLYLRGIELSYPQVLGVVQTRNAAAILLTIRDHTIHELFSSGEIDGQEYKLLQRDNNDRRKLVHEAPLFFQLPKTIQILNSNPIFSYLMEQNKFKSLVLDRGYRRVCDKGELLLKYRELSDGLYVLIRGRVHLESSEHASSLPIHRLSLLETESLNSMFCPPGSVFGLESCVFRLPMKNSVIVDSEVAHVFFLPWSSLHSIFKFQPLAALHVYRMAVVEWLKQTVPDADTIVSFLDEGRNSTSTSSFSASLLARSKDLQFASMSEANQPNSDTCSNPLDSCDASSGTAESPMNSSSQVYGTSIEDRVGPSSDVPNNFDLCSGNTLIRENVCCYSTHHTIEDIARLILSKITNSQLCYWNIGEYDISGDGGLVGVLVEGSLQVSSRPITKENYDFNRFTAPYCIDRRIFGFDSLFYLFLAVIPTLLIYEAQIKIPLPTSNEASHQQSLSVHGLTSLETLRVVSNIIPKACHSHSPV